MFIIKVLHLHHSYTPFNATIQRIVMTEVAKKRYPSFLADATWWHGAAFIGAYVILETVSARTAPELALHPGFALALAFIFFAGMRFLPSVAIGGLMAGLLSGGSITENIILTIAITLQAGAGAFLFKRRDVDPIFRHDYDVLNLIGIIALISLLYPLLLASVFMDSVQPIQRFIQIYVESIFAYIILTPFLLRWIAKPHFKRITNEIAEITIVFLMVVSVSVAHFVFGIEKVIEIPLQYVLLIPLFSIALRLRPRFVTLALVSTACIAMASAAFGGNLPMSILETQLFFIGSAVTFLIITSLEEHRRANANRFFSQMATLQNVVARVQSESQAKNNFIAILAHELRNPLAPVVSGIELLQLKNDRDADEIRILHSMSESLSTVRMLLNDLLDVSRISEGKIMLTREKLTIMAPIQKAVLATEHHRKERHQNLVMTGTLERHVYADPVRIEQVFSNLLTNASKYSKSGDTISVHVRDVGDFVEIEVVDEGVGLDSADIERIFQPFEQVTHEKRAKGGLGIGLALVRDFVHMHEGTVTAHSEGRGMGSRFLVRLPAI